MLVNSREYTSREVGANIRATYTLSLLTVVLLSQVFLVHLQLHFDGIFYYPHYRYQHVINSSVEAS